MFDTLFSFWIIILAGVVFRRLKIGNLDADSLRQAINTTVLNIFLPAFCIKIIYTVRIDIEILLIPAAAWITIIFTMLLAILVYTLLEKKVYIEPPVKGVLILSATFGNVLYFGLPILTGLFGQEAARYALFYDLLASTPLLWLVGAPLAARYGENKKMRVSESLKTVATLPPIWGIAIGIVLNLTNIPLPTFLLKALGMFGDIVIPLMIFSIGLALTFPNVKHISIIIPAVIIKLIVAPFVSFAAAYFLGLQGDALASCLIEGAMPTMVLSLLIASKFKLDVPMAALLIAVTTILSFVTLPIAIHIAQLLA